MVKILIILALVAMLIFSIVRKLKLLGNSVYSTSIAQSSDVIEIKAPLSLYKSLVQKTLVTVVIGIALLLATIILASKFKIALLMLPISLYLIAQFFILNNHIKIARDQRLFYHVKNNELEVYYDNDNKYKINLLNDTKLIVEVKSVQRNNGVLFGYYKLVTSSNQSVYIPYILRENQQTMPFFDKLELFEREIETKLFPII